MSTNPNKSHSIRKVKTDNRRTPVKTVSVLNRADFASTIDAKGTSKFEAFLDRNFPGWRNLEFHKALNADKNRREWWMGFDDFERTAICYGQYVEIVDQEYRCVTDKDYVATIIASMICDIDGDRTRVAIWSDSDPT
jgi:hypothetical protein